MLTALGFASVYIARQSEVSTGSLSYAAFFFGLYLVAHFVARYAVPKQIRTCCDGALLTAIGVTEIYRSIPTTPSSRASGSSSPSACSSRPCSCCGATTACSSRTSTSSGWARSSCSSCRRYQASARPSTAHDLWVRAGPLQFQPGELAKLALIVFLAGYLREKREVIAQGRLKDLARCS
jgi:hypothetical protein